MIYADTKIFKNNQTSIPPMIMEKLNIETNDIVEWVLDDEGKVTLNFRKKINFKEIRAPLI